jgi:hypothetical protein
VSSSGASFAEGSRAALPYLATAAIIIGFVNFFWFTFEAMALGTASSGQIIDGRYFLNNKSIYTEVGQAMWLRKMMTRYIGFSYFGLAQSQDPSSVLYDNILGPFDLDVMGEDY